MNSSATQIILLTATVSAASGMLFHSMPPNCTPNPPIIGIAGSEPAELDRAERKQLNDIAEEYAVSLEEAERLAAKYPPPASISDDQW